MVTPRAKKREQQYTKTKNKVIDIKLQVRSYRYRYYVYFYNICIRTAPAIYKMQYNLNRTPYQDLRIHTSPMEESSLTET